MRREVEVLQRLIIASVLALRLSEEAAAQTPLELDTSTASTGGDANTSLATLITINRVIEAKISQENFAGIALGQNAIVRFLGHEDDIYDAKTSKIMPTAEAETQRYIVHLDVNVKGRNELLIPGLTGEASIVVGERDAEALVPRRAVFGNGIYVVEDGRVKRRKVELGYVSLNIVEVTQGLKAGEVVIVDDIDKYREGDRVNTEVVK